MSCPECGNQDVRSPSKHGGDATWHLEVGAEYEARESLPVITFCPFCGANLAAPPLKWTREKPTVPGLYGLVDRDGRKRALEILATPLGLIVDHHNDQSLDDWKWFYGPLPFEISEPPKDSP